MIHIPILSWSSGEVLKRADQCFSPQPVPSNPKTLSINSTSIESPVDLQSIYKIFRIREEDEWKTTFVTPTGHYEY